MATKKRKTETTSDKAASDASFVMRHGDEIINEALNHIHDVKIRARVKKYHHSAKSAAASALTQKA